MQPICLAMVSSRAGARPRLGGEGGVARELRQRVTELSPRSRFKVALDR